MLNNNIAKIYDKVFLDRLSISLNFMPLLPTPSHLSVEELHRIDISNKWYDRRVKRVKRVMEAYHISASSLCECDY